MVSISDFTITRQTNNNTSMTHDKSKYNQHNIMLFWQNYMIVDEKYGGIGQ